MHVSVCISTYQRPPLLTKLLAELARQETGGRFDYSISVGDNDPAESARAVVAGLARDFPVPLTYGAEPRRSIAHVRNLTIAQSSGDLIAFIDDDEFPEQDWLLNLFDALQSHDCAGVLAPVRPFYPEGTPTWVKKGGFFERPDHETGFVMPWQKCRTGNVLFRREIIKNLSPVFSPEFGTGGSDVDFFRRMIEAGHRFIWCHSAPVFEVVPPSRWKRRILLKRALLRGRNSFRHPRGRWRGVATAAVAIPLYTLALPILQLGGHHLFMRYLVKLCDHTGRLLAAVGVDVVKQREM
jgi:glycosyltransferase involved in cell wall biosynthesis